MKKSKSAEVPSFLDRLVTFLLWFVSIFFAVTGAILLVSGSVTLGLCCLILGVGLLPLLDLPIDFRLVILFIGILIL